MKYFVYNAQTCIQGLVATVTVDLMKTGTVVAGYDCCSEND